MGFARSDCNVAANYNKDRAGRGRCGFRSRSAGRALAVKAKVGAASSRGPAALRNPHPFLKARYRGQQRGRPELEESDCDRTIAVDLKGCFFVTQRGARRWGRARSNARKTRRATTRAHGKSNAARPRGPTSRRGAYRCVPRECRRRFRHRTDHLGGWRTVCKTLLALRVDFRADDAARIQRWLGRPAKPPTADSTAS